MQIIINILNRKIAVKLMKSIFYFAPIYLITDKLYVCYFGKYNVKYDLQYIIDYFSQEHTKWLFTFFAFSTIYLLSLLTEKVLIPTLSIFFIKPIRKEDYKESNIKSYLVLKKTYGFSPLREVKNMPKIEFYTMFSFLPTVLILWLVYFNEIWSYIAILVTIILTFLLYRIINTVYRDNK